MANNNPLTGAGSTSGAGENSSSPPQPYAAQQMAVQQAEKTGVAAKVRAYAAERAAVAATGNPYNPGVSRDGIMASTNAHGTPPLNVPKRGRGK